MKYCETQRVETDRFLRKYVNEDTAAIIKTGLQIKWSQNI